MPVVVRFYFEGATQIASPLAGTEPGLLRGRPCPAQYAGVARNAGECAQGMADFFCLIEAAPPLAPPVQGNRNDDLRRVGEIQMVCQQAGKAAARAGSDRNTSAGDELGIRCPIIADHLQTLPGRVCAGIVRTAVRSSRCCSGSGAAHIRHRLSCWRWAWRHQEHNKGVSSQGWRQSRHRPSQSDWVPGSDLLWRAAALTCRLQADKQDLESR